MKTMGSGSEIDEWRPSGPIPLPPIYAWPPRPRAVAKWLFGFPGFLWPMNSLTLIITTVTWFFLTPGLSEMKTFEIWWVAVLLARNFVLVGGFVGGLHLYLLVFQAQGTSLKFSAKPLARKSARFFFHDQVRDNVFRTLFAGVPVITAFEALSYWMFANEYIPRLDVGAGSMAFWAGILAALLLAPAIHSLHFYLAHRILHWAPLYRTVHRIHHYNVEVGPWSGLAMHPIELILYFSTVCVQWVIAVHPINALFQIQIAIFNAAVSHTGFDKVVVGGGVQLESNNYFHYLHHKYFDCNYGSTLAPMDQLFGTFHDGTNEAHHAMRNRSHLRGARSG